MGRTARKLFSLKNHPEPDGDLIAFKRVLELVLDPGNQPVLFHCFGGKHRTGMIAMAIRYLQGGDWVNGKKTFFRGLELNPAQYEYLKYNRLFFRKENIKFIERFTKEDYFSFLKEKYGQYL